MQLIKVTVAVDASLVGDGICYDTAIMYVDTADTAFRLTIETIIAHGKNVFHSMGNVGDDRMYHWIKEITQLWTPQVLEEFSTY